MNNHAPYHSLLDVISNTFTQGQRQTVSAINAGLVTTYWQIGQHIVEYEQQGQTQAEYGKQLLANLSTDLKLKHGKGFSLSNLKRFRQFYLAYPIGATVSHQLSWSHHVELLKISSDTERSFYTHQCIDANWSIRELKRQKDILALATQNQLISKPTIAAGQTRGQER